MTGTLARLGVHLFISDALEARFRRVADTLTAARVVAFGPGGPRAAPRTAPRAARAAARPTAGVAAPGLRSPTAS